MPLLYKLAVCLLLASCSISLSAQVLVANISQGNAGSNPTALQSNGEYTVFLANDGATDELYYLAPEAAVPERLSNLVPGLTLEWTNNPILIGGSVYFATDLGGGTQYRRVELATGEVLEIGTFPAGYFFNHNPWFTAVNGVVLFVHPDENDQKQLYRYDPADGLVTLLAQLPEGFIQNAVPLGDRLFYDYGYFPGDLAPFAVTDGTALGTLVRFPPEGAAYVAPLATVGSRTIVQVLAQSSGTFVYDENFSEALPLREVYPSIPEGTVRDFTLRSDGLYFSLQTPELKVTIYRVDTATSVAEPVLELNPDRDSVYLRSLQFYPDRIFYTLIPQGSRSHALYSSDGTAEGVLLLDSITTRSFNSYTLGQIVASDGSYYFLADRPDTGTELWRTDGTPEGTRPLADLYPGPSSPDISEPIPTGDGIVFTAEHPDYGREVFTVQDESQTVGLLLDVNTRETGSYPLPLAVVNDRLLLAATTPCTGFELFATERSGTTSLIRDLEPGREGSDPRVSDLLGDTAYFVAGSTSNYFLYGSDGTADGTFALDPQSSVGKNSLIAGGTRLGDRLLLRTYVNGVGQALYSIDPPAGQYELIKVFESGFGFNSSGTGFVALNDSILLFEETTEEYGTELWRTDGTAEGTYLVKDIRQVEEDTYYGHLSRLTVIDGLAYFSADYGEGRRPFRSDGTEEGTYELTGSGNLQNPSDAFAYAGRVYFAAGSYGSQALYSTTGEPFDVIPSPITASTQLASISNLRVLGERLVFTANNGDNGEELWGAAGPEAGATLLKDFLPGPYPSYPRNLFVVNDTMLLLSAETSVLGRELWMTDGTTAGTVLVADLQAGPASSNPENFFAFDGFVYFSADDGEVGAELWKYAPDGNYPESTDPNDVQVACAAPPTSSTEVAEISVRAYPNPVADYLRVELPEDLTVRASLHASNGQTVYASDRAADRFTIPVRELAAGAYTLLLRQRSGDILGQRRIIVAR